MSNFEKGVNGIVRLAVLLAMVAAVDACHDDDLLAPLPPHRGIQQPNKTLSDRLAVTGPVDMNTAGEVLGSLYVGTTYHSAISLHRVAYDLGITDGSANTDSHPAAINKRGQVVGNEFVSGAFSRSFLWTPDQDNGTTGTFRRLTDTPHGPATASDINDAGEIVGDAPSGIVLWIGVEVVELPLPIAGGIAHSTSINQFGQVAGTATDANGAAHAFLWTPNSERGTTGSYVLLDAAGVGGSTAGSVNDFGQVVVTGSDGQARVWTPASPNGTTGSFVALDGPYGPLNIVDIDNRGNVLANGAGFVDNYCGPTMSIYLWRPSSPNGSAGVLLNVTPDIGLGDYDPIYGTFPQGFCWANGELLSEEENGSLQVFGQLIHPGGDGVDQTWTFTGFDAPPLSSVITTINPPHENETVVFDGQGTNPYFSVLSYQWDFGDGATGWGGSVWHKYDDSGAYTVRLTVSDSTGQSSTTSTTITVANDAPGGLLTISPTSLPEGGSYVMRMSQISDAPGDVATLQLSLDCGDGRGYQSAAVSSALTCAALSAGLRTARAQLRDKDGGVTEYASQVSIQDVAPVLAILSAPTSVSEQSTFTVSFKFTDPGLVGSWSYAVNWGDGTSTSPITVASQGGSLSASHRFSVVRRGGVKSAAFIVTVSVSDNGGATGFASSTVVVSTK